MMCGFAICLCRAREECDDGEDALNSKSCLHAQDKFQKRYASQYCLPRTWKNRSYRIDVAHLPDDDAL